jgi:hypothetical protein
MGSQQHLTQLLFPNAFLTLKQPHGNQLGEGLMSKAICFIGMGSKCRNMTERLSHDMDYALESRKEKRTGK